MLPKRLRQNELLSAYVEPLAAGRRVVVIGAEAASLGEKLIELGARAVHAYEVDPSTDSQAGAGVIVRHYQAGDVFDVREGAFDVAIIPNVVDLAPLDAVLSRVRRWIGPAGVLVAGVPADGAFGYYELYDAVSAQFAEIAMVGQVPFSGAALAVLGDEGEPEVSVDTQLAGDAVPPDYFVALASEAPLDVRPYVILQLPADDDRRDAPSERDVVSEEDILSQRAIDSERDIVAAIARDREREEERDRDRAALAEARLRADVLQTQVEEQRVRVNANLETVRQLEQELARRDEQARILVQNAQAAEAATRALEAQLVQVERLAGTRDEHLERALARAVELEALLARSQSLELSAKRAEQASLAAQALEAELIELAEAHAAEVGLLEEALRERGREIHAMQRELVRRERMIKELLVAYEQVQPAALAAAAPDARQEHPAATQASAPDVRQPSPAPKKGALPDARPESPAAKQAAAQAERLALEVSQLRAQLETLAVDAARREGELQAMRWRNEELELQRAASASAQPLASASEPFEPQGDRSAPESPSLERDTLELSRLRDEIDMLRQALRQEHDARVKAETAADEQRLRSEQASKDVDASVGGVGG